MSLLAAIRPDSWDVPLFLHVLGATVLVGGLLSGAATLALAHGQERYLRLGYWTLLAVALPGYVLMRIGAQWIYSKEFGDTDASPTWIDIGYATSDIGLLLLLVGLIAVLNLVDRLEKRGWLKRTKSDQVFRYTATIDEQKATSQVASEFVNEFFQGSASDLVMSLLGSHRLSSQEVDELRKILDAAATPSSPRKGKRS